MPFSHVEYRGDPVPSPDTTNMQVKRDWEMIESLAMGRLRCAHPETGPSRFEDMYFAPSMDYDEYDPNKLVVVDKVNRDSGVWVTQHVARLMMQSLVELHPNSGDLPDNVTNLNDRRLGKAA